MNSSNNAYTSTNISYTISKICNNPNNPCGPLALAWLTALREWATVFAASRFLKLWVTPSTPLCIPLTYNHTLTVTINLSLLSSSFPLLASPLFDTDPYLLVLYLSWLNQHPPVHPLVTHSHTHHSHTHTDPHSAHHHYYYSHYHHPQPCSHPHDLIPLWLVPHPVWSPITSSSSPLGSFTSVRSLVSPARACIDSEGIRFTQAFL